MRFTNLVLGIVGVGALAVPARRAAAAPSGRQRRPAPPAPTGAPTTSGASGCAPTATCAGGRQDLPRPRRQHWPDHVRPAHVRARRHRARRARHRRRQDGRRRRRTADNTACNLDGSGTFSWLLQFDTTAGTLKTGGARPVAEPTTGYSFEEGMVAAGGEHVQRPARRLHRYHAQLDRRQVQRHHRARTSSSPSTSTRPAPRSCSCRSSGAPHQGHALLVAELHRHLQRGEPRPGQ